MQTKFEIGQRVLVPVTIRAITADEQGNILYKVDSEDYWDGFTEDVIVEDEKAINTDALKVMAEQMMPVR